MVPRAADRLQGQRATKGPCLGQPALGFERTHVYTVSLSLSSAWVLGWTG
jgi:hypothetical protein